MVGAREYHERTKHSPRSVREGAVGLDRSNQPRPYKLYEDLPRVAPPGDPSGPSTAALSAIAEPGPTPRGRDGPSPSATPDLHALCYYATGVTRVIERGGRTLRFRAASCTGKLYHVDLYAVTDGSGAFDAGVYHYDPETNAFDVLREGDYRGVLAAAAGATAGEDAEATAGEDAEATAGEDRETDGTTGVADAPVTFVATSEWWRNAWKYGERTYRHAFWDSGTVLANLLAVAHGFGHRAAIVLGFDDDPVARLLGVDPAEEAPLELVPVGAGSPVPAVPEMPPIDPAEAPLSDEVVEYPLVPDAWRQSRLADGAAARRWRAARRGDDGLGTVPPGDGERVDLDPVDGETASARPVGATIERRGSLRDYAREPISARLLATVLDRALRGLPFARPVTPRSDRTPDDPGDPDGPTDRPGAPRLVDYYCLVHAVDGIPTGAYQYHPAEGVLERVGDTDRDTAAHLALDQGVVGDTAAQVYAMADLDAIVDRLGDRGYRLAQLAGGIALGRLYLATYAHRSIGGRGFTFYDDLVTEHLSPRAVGQTPMTTFAFGPPAR